MIQKAAEDKFGLGIFIRSLVGMEREAVSQAFSDVIAGTQATPDQIEFIELIVAGSKLRLLGAWARVRTPASAGLLQETRSDQMKSHTKLDRPNSHRAQSREVH